MGHTSRSSARLLLVLVATMHTCLPSVTAGLFGNNLGVGVAGCGGNWRLYPEVLTKWTYNASIRGIVATQAQSSAGLPNQFTGYCLSTDSSLGAYPTAVGTGVFLASKCMFLAFCPRFVFCAPVSTLRLLSPPPPPSRTASLLPLSFPRILLLCFLPSTCLHTRTLVRQLHADETYLLLLCTTSHMHLRAVRPPTLFQHTQHAFFSFFFFPFPQVPSLRRTVTTLTTIQHGTSPTPTNWFLYSTPRKGV